MYSRKRHEDRTGRRIALKPIMYRKKQRGQARKLKKLKEYLISYTSQFPILKGGCVHWHMTCRQDFLDSSKTSSKIKTQVIQYVINCAQHLYAIKPKEIEFCKIVCVFTFPLIWDSQIIVFSDIDYYNNFFDRNDDYQKWTRIEMPSLKIQRNLKTIPEFLEKCYLEEINDEEDGSSYRQYLWFYGELNK